MTKTINLHVLIPFAYDDALRARLRVSSPHATIEDFLIAALNDYLAAVAQKPVQARIQKTLVVQQTQDSERQSLHEYRLMVADPAQRFCLSNLQQMESDPGCWLARIANRYLEKLSDPTAVPAVAPDRSVDALYRLMGIPSPSARPH